MTSVVNSFIFIAETKEVRDEMQNPYWMDDKHWTRGKVDFLDNEEKVFWVELIEKYLKPVVETDEQKVRLFVIQSEGTKPCTDFLMFCRKKLLQT